MSKLRLLMWLLAAAAVSWLPGLVRAQASRPTSRPDAGVVRDDAGQIVSELHFPADKEQVVVPLLRGGRFLLTREVRINGEDVGLFLIDSGAHVSVLDRHIADRMGLKLIDGSAAPYAATQPNFRRIKSISIGDLSITNHFMVAADLSSNMSEFRGTFAGILGSEIFGRLPFEVDYQASSLTFYDPAQFKAPAGADAFDMTVMGGPGEENIFLKANPNAGWPVVEARVNDLSVRAFLDTSCIESVRLLPDLIRAHPDLANTAVPARGMPMPYYPARIASLSVLGQTISPPHQPAALVDPPERTTSSNWKDMDVVIGEPILEGYALTFDYASGRLYARRLPPPPATLPAGFDVNAQDFSGYTPVMTAAMDGDLPRVQAMLALQPALTMQTAHGLTALHCAVESGNRELLHLMLQQPGAGKAVNLTNGYGRCAMMAAAEAGNAEMINDLLDAGASIDLTDAAGQSALVYAVRNLQEPAVKALLARQADVNIANKVGVTALGAAADAGSIAIYDLLLQAGAKHNPAGDGITLLHLAAKSGNAELVKHIIKDLPEKPDLNAAMFDGTTPLMAAAQFGRVEAAAALLDAGADVNGVAHAAGDGTALDDAAIQGSVEMVQLLLKRGAHVDARGTTGMTALMLAAGLGHAQVVQALLDAGAKLDAVDADNCSALHAAARQGQTAVVELLLKKGADVNAKAKYDTQPLHMACINGHLETARLLLRSGADIHARMDNGQTAIALARRAGYTDIVKLLDDSLVPATAPSN